MDKRSREHRVESSGPDRTVGVVFEVKRGAVHDGPGWRTTVFLKGCPLQCPWCHNPEGMVAGRELWVRSGRCMGCGACVAVCPQGIPVLGEHGLRAFDPVRCRVCGSCVEACPTGARSVVGTSMGAGELVDVLCRDRVFYEVSGGGVTFSGGEPLLQMPFLVEALARCRTAGLHTAVDTCGAGPTEDLLHVARLADLVLFDVKHVHPDRHEAVVGAPLTPILANLRALDHAAFPYRVRIPLIPGFNDDAVSREGYVDLLSRLRGHPVVSLLPYHRAGAAKYERLGRAYAMEGVAPLDPGVVERWVEELQTACLRVRVGG